MRTTLRAAIFVLGSFAISVTARAGAVDEAMQADRDFAKMAQTKGVAEAFAAYALDAGVLLVPGPEPVRGRAALKALMEESFADGGKLEWEPKEGVASGDGRMAMTWGRSVYTSAKNAKGESVVRLGNYLTVWHKQKDGSWKFSYDIGNRDPVPAP
ncbi:MAG: DUF4440 domain-containing protein [Micropepsaceae bacterium]